MHNIAQSFHSTSHGISLVAGKRKKKQMVNRQ